MNTFGMQPSFLLHAANERVSKQFGKNLFGHNCWILAEQAEEKQ